MLSGNNGNTLPPVFINENQLQYQTNTQSNQLHLLGTSGGCTLDPVNYFVRKAANIHKENLVCTGLRLSNDDEEHNSSVTSTSPIFQSFNNTLQIDLQRQKDELDHFLKIQTAQMAKGVKNIKQRQITSFLTTIEKRVSKKVQEKDDEIENMKKKNKEFMERIKQVAMETQNWQYRAKHNESLVNVLKTKLQQAMSNVIVAEEGFGDSEIEASSYIDSKKMIQRMRCRMCNLKEACVLILPCRHLSLCKECDVFSGFCPLCKSFKTESVLVFFS